VSRDDLACRYGLFLDFLARSGRLNAVSDAARLIIPDNVSAYLAEIKDRVSSVSVHGAIAKLRRMGEILDPTWNSDWLREIEQDLAWEMRPAPKQHRVVDSDRLWQLGMDLMREAEEGRHLPPVRRCLTFRNGLMVALLASCPIRLKNLAALEIGTTLRRVGDTWVIALPGTDTKAGRPDERPVSMILSHKIRDYMEHYRRPSGQTNSLWIGRLGELLTYSTAERAITETVRKGLGIAISPHLFRSCAASTVYRHASGKPGMAAAVLQHTDPRVTEKHYNRARSVEFADAFLRMVENDGD
jgi:integrase